MPHAVRRMLSVHKEMNKAEHGVDIIIAVCRHGGRPVDMLTFEAWIKEQGPEDDKKTSFRLLRIQAVTKLINEGKLPGNCFPIFAIDDDGPDFIAFALDTQAARGRQHKAEQVLTLDAFFVIFGKEEAP